MGHEFIKVDRTGPVATVTLDRPGTRNACSMSMWLAIRDAFREIRVKTARMNTYLNEQISGMAVVQAYAREERSAEEFDAINSAYRAANNRSIVYDASLDAAIEMVSSVCIAAILWYAGVRSHEAHVSFGTLFAFVAYIEMFFVPIRDLSMNGIGLVSVQKVDAGARLVVTVANKANSIAKTLLVKVVHSKPISGGYLIAGDFVAPLTYQEFVGLVM